MPVHRSAMGKQVDMGALLKKNEKTRAVGNMSVNARGDTIDSHGRIIKPVTEKVNDQYVKTVGNKSAKHTNNQGKRPELNGNFHKTTASRLEEDIINDLERDLESEIDDDLEVEKIKAKEVNNNARN